MDVNGVLPVSLRMRRVLVFCSGLGIAIAAVLYAAVSLSGGDEDRGALGAEVEIVYLRAPDMPSSRAAEESLSQAASLITKSPADDLTAVELDGQLLVIDASAFSAVDTELLGLRVSEGTPLVAVNVSLAELYAATGFIEKIRALDPVGAADYDPAPSYPESEYYSWLYISGPDAAGVYRFGSGQGRFVDGDRLFEAQLRSLGLTAKGLTREQGGAAAPIESLSTPPSN
jgi:hypothetical protein